MNAQPPLATPNPAASLGVILRSLAALVARRFLNHPRHVVFIIPLWRHLTRAACRLETLLARLAAGPLPPPRPRTPHQGGARRKPEFPTGRAWLIRALGPEAAVHAAQLEALLARPEAAADLLANPTAARILAPIRRMLGQVPPRQRKPRPPAPKAPLPPPIPAHQNLDPPANRPRRPVAPPTPPAQRIKSFLVLFCNSQARGGESDRPHPPGAVLVGARS